MNVLSALVEWIHVGAAMLWVGGAFFLDFFVLAQLRRNPLEDRRLAGTVAVAAGRFFGITGGLTLLFGIVRGTVLGPITSFAALGSSYGIMWLAALVVTVAIAALGGRVLGPSLRALFQNTAIWTPSPGGGPSAELVAGLERAGRIGRVQTVGFAVVLVGMVAMGTGIVS